MKKITLILFAFFLYCQSSAQTSNLGFEQTAAGTYTSATAVSGWSISSQTSTTCLTSTVWTSGSPEFSIVPTPILSSPVIGTIPNSPLGGTVVARLNNSTANASITRLQTTVAVLNSSSLLQIAFAGIMEDGGHTCCSQSGFKLNIYNNAGSLLTCQSYSAQAAGSMCINSVTGFSVTSGTLWTNWQIKYIDLTPYVGTNITLEAVVNDCTMGDHYGTLFVDVSLSSFLFGSGVTIQSGPTPVFNVNYCVGSSLATINGPAGYATYSWTPPLGAPSISSAQATLSTLNVSNPVALSVYTLNLSTASGCIYLATYTMSPSTVAIAGIGSGASCIGGTSGTATVVATGSGGGYNYSWINSTNSVLSTNSVVNGLASGIYSIVVTAAGSQSATCGTAVTTVTIGAVSPQLIQYLNPYCGSEAYLGVNGGSNFQWYNGTSPISSTLGGTASSYTVTSPINGSNYRLRYTSPFGCLDSIKYTLVSINPGSLSVSFSSLICPNTATATAFVTLVPAAGSPSGLNSYSVFSMGSSTPVYNATLNPTALTVFTVSGLSAGGTYSVNAFDGSCKYSQSFSATPYVFNYSLSVSSVTLCSGNAIQISVTFTSPPSIAQYSYSWSPSTFLFGGTAQYAIILPSIAPGTFTTITYSVVVTPSIVNCPLTKTLSVTAANPLTPTISNIPQLCVNATPHTITTNPPGGTFINGSGSAIGSLSGILTPSATSIGAHTFTYANSIGTCVAKSSKSYTINPLPVITISGNTTICEGQQTVLLASGASTYSWSNSSPSPFITISPSLSTTYMVLGTNAITNCSDSKTVAVLVDYYSVLTIAGNTTLCAGESATLVANGANTYSWSNGSSSQAITVTPNATTSYSLVGTSALANCSSTQALSVNVITCSVSVTAIKEWTSKENLNIYPNPTSDKLFIETKNNITITVYDGLGRIILEENLVVGNHFIDIRNFLNGVYLLQINGGISSKTIKLVKAD